jgi:hypothetical protein
MRRTGVLALVGAALLCCTPRGRAENFRGPFYTEELRVEANDHRLLNQNADVPRKNRLYRLREYVKFKAGRRASVIVKGDHRPIAPLTLEIFDEKGNLVARDDPGKGVGKTDAKGNDYAGVVWYPPRDGYYTIKITNHHNEYNQCYLSIN